MITRTEDSMIQRKEWLSKKRMKGWGVVQRQKKNEE
jgi:hypothetical protein